MHTTAASSSGVQLVASSDGCLTSRFIVGQWLCEVERFDPLTNQWTLIAPMHHSRTGVAVTALRGKEEEEGGGEEEKEEGRERKREGRGGGGGGRRRKRRKEGKGGGRRRKRREGRGEEKGRRRGGGGGWGGERGGGWGRKKRRREGRGGDEKGRRRVGEEKEEEGRGRRRGGGPRAPSNKVVSYPDPLFTAADMKSGSGYETSNKGCQHPCKIIVMSYCHHLVANYIFAFKSSQ